MNKILYLIIGIILLIGIASAGKESLGVFKQNEVVRVVQICDDALNVTITSISYPNGSTAFSNGDMTPAGNGEFYLNFPNTTSLGVYDVRGVSDGCEGTFTFWFEITPSGNSGNANIVFFIIIMVIVYGIAFFGLFGRNVILTILGGMAMLILGIYLFNNGIIVYRDDITRAISYITIGIGAVLAIWGSYEWYQDL